MKPAIIYDVETKKRVEKNSESFDIAKHCRSWTDYESMGIACIAAYDTKHDRPYVFMENELLEFQKLIDASDLVVDFNGYNFDLKLLKHFGVSVKPTKHFDILRQVWKGLGLDPNTYKSDTHGGVSLDALATENLGRGKSHQSSEMADYWHRGNVGTVVTHCLDDVYMTKELLELVVIRGFLTDPVSKRQIPISKPW